LKTCKLHGVDTQAYLTDVLTKLVNLQPASRLDELMRWAWAANRSANCQAAWPWDNLTVLRPAGPNHLMATYSNRSATDSHFSVTT
jgi:hypothetical protein